MTPSAQSHTCPFVDVFRDLRGSLSYAKVAAASAVADPVGGGLSRGFLSLLGAGIEPPTSRVMELLADIFDVSPMTFAEYRLAAARAALDPRNDGGLEAAVARLDRLEAASGGPLTAERVSGLGHRKLAA